MIEHYDTLGYVVVVTMIVMTAMLYPINRAINKKYASMPPNAKDVKAAEVEVVADIAA